MVGWAATKGCFLHSQQGGKSRKHLPRLDCSKNGFDNVQSKLTGKKQGNLERIPTLSWRWGHMASEIL